MTTIKVDVCVCTECVMNGAMDIMQAIEDMKNLNQEEENNYADVNVEITPVKCLGEGKHGKSSPRVSINGTIYDKVNTQTVMSEIITMLQE